MAASVRRELAMALDLDEKGFVDGAARAEAAAGGFEKELEEVAAAAREADAAMDGLDGAKLPEMGQKASEVRFRLEELERATQKLVKAGGAIPAQLTAKVQDYGEKLETAALKGERFKRTQAEVTREAQSGAASFDAISIKGKGFGDILGQLNTESGKLGAGLGKFGPLIGAVTGAFASGIAIGNQVREKWDDIARSIDQFIPGTKRVADAFKAMGKEAVDSLAKIVVGVDGAISAVDRMGVSAQSNVGKANRLKGAIEGVSGALEQQVGVWKENADAQRKNVAEVAAVSKALDQVSAISGADYDKWVRDNAESLHEWYERLDESGKALADHHPKVAEAVKRAKEFLESQGKLTKATEATTAALEKQGAAVTTWSQKVDEANSGLAKRLDDNAAVLDAAAKRVDEIVAARNKRIDDAAAGPRKPQWDNAFDPVNIERAAAAEQRWAQAIMARNAALAEADYITAQQNEALRQIATTVEALGDSVYDSLPKIREYFAEFDEAAGETFAAGWINNVVNAFKEGTLAGRDAAVMLGEIQDGMRRLVGMGALFLAEDLAKLDQIKTAFARTAEAIRQEKRRLKFEFPEELDAQPDGESRTSGAGVAGGSEGSRNSRGAFGRITGEMTKTRTP